MNADSVRCPTCGYYYEGRGLTQERRRAASVIALDRHWKQTHGGDRASLIAAAQAQRDRPEE